MRRAAAVIAATTLAGAAMAAELRGPGEFTGIADESARAVALLEEMGKVLQAPAA